MTKRKHTCEHTYILYKHSFSASLFPHCFRASRSSCPPYPFTHCFIFHSTPPPPPPVAPRFLTLFHLIFPHSFRPLESLAPRPLSGSSSSLWLLFPHSGSSSSSLWLHRLSLWLLVLSLTPSFFSLAPRSSLSLITVWPASFSSLAFSPTPIRVLQSVTLL